MPFDTFTTAFIECLLWSETDDDGEPFDGAYTPDDIAPESLAEVISDCDAFQSDHADDIGADLAQAGHDFCLTRNRHGAGSGDGDWAEPAAGRLTAAAHVYGTMGLYRGDDGRLYVHG